MSRDPDDFLDDGDRQFRRGAIMGLTVAESFMLVAFALLMLLALWKIDSDKALELSRKEAADNAQAVVFTNKLSEKDKTLVLETLRSGGLASLQERAELIAPPDMRRLAEAASGLEAPQREALADLLEHPERLEPLAEVLETPEALETVARLGVSGLAALEGAEGGAEGVAEALADGASVLPEKALRPMRDAKALLEEPEMKRLAAAARRLPPEKRRTFAEIGESAELLNLADTAARMPAKDRAALASIAGRPDLVRPMAEVLAEPAASATAAALGPKGLAAMESARGGAAKLADDLEKGASVLSEAELQPMREAKALLAEPGMRTLAETARKMSPETRPILERLGDRPDLAKLADVMATGADTMSEAKFEAMLDAAKAPGAGIDDLRKLAAGGKVVTAAQAAIVQGRDLAELLDIAKRYDALQAKYTDGVNRVADQQTDLGARIEASFGESVRGLGGRVEADGAIILPESVVFERREFVPKPKLKVFLDSFCRKWVGELATWDGSISDIRIEGHSSSEWGAEPPASAFVKNLELSQKRSGAVLSYCLETLRNDKNEAWARKRLTAVGYSSSRPAVDDKGVADPDKSRRVEFRATVDSRPILEQLRRDVSRQEPAAPRR